MRKAINMGMVAGCKNSPLRVGIKRWYRNVPPLPRITVSSCWWHSWKRGVAWWYDRLDESMCWCIMCFPWRQRESTGKLHSPWIQRRLFSWWTAQGHLGNWCAQEKIILVIFFAADATNIRLVVISGDNSVTSYHTLVAIQAFRHLIQRFDFSQDRTILFVFLAVGRVAYWSSCALLLIWEWRGLRRGLEHDGVIVNQNMPLFGVLAVQDAAFSIFSKEE